MKNFNAVSVSPNLEETPSGWDILTEENNNKQSEQPKQLNTYEKHIEAIRKYSPRRAEQMEEEYRKNRQRMLNEIREHLDAFNIEWSENEDYGTLVQRSEERIKKKKAPYNGPFFTPKDQRLNNIDITLEDLRKENPRLHKNNQSYGTFGREATISGYYQKKITPNRDVYQNGSDEFNYKGEFDSVI